MSAQEDAYHELSAYTLSHGDPRFIHQHVVDAWGAQTAVEGGKPIRLMFSLAGLYLHLEKGRTGRDVQLIHIRMGRRKRDWPRLPLPIERGSVTPVEVMQQPPGPARDQAIEEWCASVWDVFKDSRAEIVRVLSDCGIE